MLKKWFWNILISIDQFSNVIFWGDPDETISSRIGKMEAEGRGNIVTKPLCWMLDKLDPNHCEESIEDDEGKDEVT